MKTNLITIALVALCISAQLCSAQQRIYADTVLSSGPCSPVEPTCLNGVINPELAVDGDNSTYAVIGTALGIANTSSLTLGFSQYGPGGMGASVLIQSDNGLLTADVLQSLTISLLDSKGKVIAEKGGADFANAQIVDGSATYNIGLRTKDHNFNIAAMRIDMNGLVSVANGIRVYTAYLYTVCPDFTGNVLHASNNVQNPSNAITPGKSTYALLTPPLLLGNSYLDIAFSEPADAGKHIYFSLGQGNTLLGLSLLQTIEATIYDTNGNIVVDKKGFALADVEALKSDGSFALNIATPAGSYSIGRARITMASLVNLETLKVFYTFYLVNDRPPVPSIKVHGSTEICNGDSLKLTAVHELNEDVSYQWYHNGIRVDNGTDQDYYAKDPGQYSVLVLDLSGCSSISEDVVVTRSSCHENAVSNLGVQVFPNPCVSYATMNIASATQEKTEIIVSDKSGSIVETHELSAGQGSVKLLERAPQGIYFIKIISGNTIETQKIIKL